MRKIVHEMSDELRVWLIPADTDLKMELKVVKFDFFMDSLRRLLGGGWIEIVRTRYMPELPCGCRVVMLVDEEGRLKNFPQNVRASYYYPWNFIVGDALLVAEGLVTSGGVPELGFVSLPPELHDWEGPGSPLPELMMRTKYHG